LTDELLTIISFVNQNHQPMRILHVFMCAGLVGGMQENENGMDVDGDQVDEDDLNFLLDLKNDGVDDAEDHVDLDEAEKVLDDALAKDTDYISKMDKAEKQLVKMEEDVAGSDPDLFEDEHQARMQASYVTMTLDEFIDKGRPDALWEAGAEKPEPKKYEFPESAHSFRTKVEQESSQGDEYFSLLLKKKKKNGVSTLFLEMPFWVCRYFSLSTLGIRNCHIEKEHRKQFEEKHCEGSDRIVSAAPGAIWSEVQKKWQSILNEDKEESHHCNFDTANKRAVPLMGPAAAGKTYSAQLMLPVFFPEQDAFFLSVDGGILRDSYDTYQEALHWAKVSNILMFENLFSKSWKKLAASYLKKVTSLGQDSEEPDWFSRHTSKHKGMLKKFVFAAQCNFINPETGSSKFTARLKREYEMFSDQGWDLRIGTVIVSKGQAYHQGFQRQWDESKKYNKKQFWGGVNMAKTIGEWWQQHAKAKKQEGPSVLVYLNRLTRESYKTMEQDDEDKTKLRQKTEGLQYAGLMFNMQDDGKISVPLWRDKFREKLSKFKTFREKFGSVSTFGRSSIPVQIGEFEVGVRGHLYDWNEEKWDPRLSFTKAGPASAIWFKQTKKWDVAPVIDFGDIKQYINGENLAIEKEVESNYELFVPTSSN